MSESLTALPHEDAPGGALVDAEQAADWSIGRDAWATAQTRHTKIEHASAWIVVQPELGMQGPARTRMLPIRHFPMSLMYRVQGDASRLAAVAARRHRPRYWSAPLSAAKDGYCRSCSLLLQMMDLTQCAHFIVLHTIPSFNFCERNGVVLYEWNVFRNLLRRGQITRAKFDATTNTVTPMAPVYASGVLPLEDVEAVIDHLVSAEEVERSVFDAHRHLYANGSIFFPAPVLPGWTTWLKVRRQTRIVVPLL